MTESEFTRLADAAFTRIENALDSNDIDYNFNGPVLEIEFDDGTQVIINRHTPNQEIWLAAKSGGFHYSFRDGRWASKRDDSELFDKLSELVRLGGGANISFEANADY
ncbi:MAG: iron donor protein CyaY [Gallionellaceae bacterium]|nr:MAG: iron donor protein CyaY [Gallionellaceae bacterium]